MGLQNLTDVHAARHAQRIEHDVDRRSVFQMRHVFDRNDLGDDALVAVTAGHLVARLQLALHRDEHLDHLHHARRQFVAAAQLVDLVGEARFEAVLGFVVLLAQRFDLALRLFVAQRELPPLNLGQRFEQRRRHLRIRRHALGPVRDLLVQQKLFETRVDVALQDREFVVAVLGEALDFFAFDRQRALVLLDAVAVEDAHFDDRAGRARRQTQARVANVGGLFAEDRAQQFFFRRHRAFALRRDLADEDVARRSLRRRYRRCRLRRGS